MWFNKKKSNIFLAIISMGAGGGEATYLCPTLNKPLVIQRTF